MSYICGPKEDLIVRLLKNSPTKGVKCVLLEGLPGTGKTAFSSHLANEYGAKYHYVLCHNWITDEEMFVAPNLGAIVTATVTPETVWSDGFLARVARETHNGPVVACIDELDKAPERMEVLLLDFLQSGKVHTSNGKLMVQANTDNLIIILTSNQQRGLLDATRRRCIKHEMAYLSEKVEAQLLRKITGAPMGLITILIKAVNSRRSKHTPISLQEMVNYLSNARSCTSSKELGYLESFYFGKELGIANRINGILAASRKDLKDLPIAG